MIALASECLVFRLDNGESVPLSPDMVSVELVGEAAPLFDPDFVTQAANAVFFYFKHELGRDSVTVGEFTLALETALRGFNLTEENLARAWDQPGTASADLCDLAGESGEGFELVFFPRLRNELRAQLQQEASVLRFQGLKNCVKLLTGARRWTSRCQELNDRIVGFLRDCLSTEAGRRACTLRIE
jgi:hypothetical protein